MQNKILFAALIIISIYACNDHKKDWALYNNAVVQEVKVADSTIKELFTFKDFEKFPETKHTYTDALEKVQNNLNAITSPGSEDSLRLTALELTNVYMDITTNDYQGIYTYMHDSIYTPADSVSVDSLSDMMYSKWQIASEKFGTMQLHFSKKYKIELE